MSLRTDRILRLIVGAGVFGGIFFLLSSGIFEDTARLDLISYVFSADAFFNNINPYSKESIEGYSSVLVAKPVFQRIIWNPPHIFLWFLPLRSFDPMLLGVIWRTLLLISVCIISYLGLRLGDRQGKPLLIYVPLLAVTSIPFLRELAVLQITSILSVLFFIGAYLFFERKHELGAELRKIRLQHKGYD